ncbi:MAG: hypothetical protein ACRDWD_06755 [Acidimicrobiia bacterium]
MQKSMLESMATGLRRAALALMVVFVLAAVGAIQYVRSEEDVGPLRYVAATAAAGTYLIAAVIAWTGSLVIRALSRVRQHLLDAIFETKSDVADNEFDL